MEFLYPAIEPFKSGLLEVDDGIFIYWEASGNPNGIPALYLHGGPGGGIKKGYRRRYNPQKYLIISFEQRGCGRSRPLITDSLDFLHKFVTNEYILDIEKLRVHLNISSWLVSGMSWGTTLALAYAQAYPSRVSGLVLAAINLATPSEVRWITEDIRAIFPEEWKKFNEAVCPKLGQRLIDAYYDSVLSHDVGVRQRAYDAWCQWEIAHVSLDPLSTPNPSFDDDTYRAVFATQVIHFWKHGAFMDNSQLVNNMERLNSIPGVLIHGRLDVSSPIETAWKLNNAWNSATFVIVEDEGHGGPKMIQAFVEATDELLLKCISSD
jgi:proline iminopeptidase